MSESQYYEFRGFGSTADTRTDLRAESLLVSRPGYSPAFVIKPVLGVERDGRLTYLGV